MREQKRSGDLARSPLAWLDLVRSRRRSPGGARRPTADAHAPSAPRLLDAAVGTAVIATDLEGRVTVFSAGAERLLGHSATRVVGHDVGRLLVGDDAAPLSPAPQRAVDVLTAHLRDSDRPQVGDRVLAHADGSRRTVSLTVSPLRDDSGARTGYVAVGHDVTELRAAQAAAARDLVGELTSARDDVQRLRESDRATAEFISTMCHELRTPITSIMGYTELLTEGAAQELLPEQRSLLGVVTRNSHRLLVLIEDLLTLSRIESGTHASARRPVDLRDAVQGAREALRPTLEARRLEVAFDLPDAPVTVNGDLGQLERAVLNLLTNAVKFTADGGAVAVRLVTSEGGARLVVSDTGIGVPADEQHRLFTRFFRSSVATGHGIQGTGLGLSIVRSVVTGHGGEVEVTSAVGEGTTVTVDLPLSHPAGAGLDRPLEAAR